jgi:hypothetical protein
LNSTSGPKPTTMPLDTAAWARQLNLSNFVNTYYQYRDLQRLANIRRILVVGPGQGLDTAVLRWRGYEVVTFDIDTTFQPDVIGSVHDMKVFSDREFDAVIASHVIEHLPMAYLDEALRELARVARFALVYLPTTGRPVALTLSPGFRGLRWSLIFDVYNWFKKPDPNRPVFCKAQHYWEIGRRGFSRRKVVRLLSRHFRILDQYRNKDWLLSMNFVLAAKGPSEP